MTQLILSTGNIISSGPSIIRKPGETRSNFELTTSLRSNFLSAQQDYGAEPTTNGNAATTNGAAPPTSAWTAPDGDTLYIPRIDWDDSPGLSEEASRYEVTVKLFYLPGSVGAEVRAAQASAALELVCRELGVPAADLLIVSFPGMSFDGDCEWKADTRNAAQGDDAAEAATWAAAAEALHAAGRVRRLGIAEFGSEKLGRLLGAVKVPPQVDQINIRDCCNVPPPLVKLAKERGIELLVHSDCTDVLPKGTLREILGQGESGAGLLADPETGKGGLKGDLTPQWVVKYTAVVKDRGVIENKGYFAGAELKET